MQTRSFLLLVGLLLYFAVEGYCQHPITRHYTVDDGLPSNHVYSIIQDEKGFIWFATNNGVSRFDGRHFKSFSAANGLPDNEIVEIQPDISGRIWLSCYNGTPCFIRGNAVFTPENCSILKQLQVCNPPCRFTRCGKKLVLSYLDGGCLESDTSLRIKHKIRGRLLAGCNNRLLSCWDEIAGQKFLLFDEHFRPIDSFIRKGGKKSADIATLTFLDDQTFGVFGKDGSCEIFDIGQNRIKTKDSLRLPFIYTCIYRYNNQLWAASDGNGIMPINSRGQSDASRQPLFAHKQVHRFLKDREGNYWGCSLGNGVFMIPNKNILLYDVADGLCQNNVLKTGAYGNQLVLGYNNVTIQTLTGKKIEAHSIKSKTSEIISPNIAITANERFLVSGSDEGIVAVDKRNNRTHHLKLPALKSLYLFSDTLLAGTYGGCYIIKLPGTIIDKISCGRTMAVYRSKDGAVLAGNLKELVYCIRDSQGRWVVDKPLQATGIRKELCISRIIEMGNRLIIGTEQQGILAVEGKNHEFIQLGKDLQQVNCKSLILDRHGTLWAASFHGIHRIQFGNSIHEYTVTNYTKQNGLPYEDINDIQIVNDTIYAACSNGLICFSINDKKQQAGLLPVIHLTNMRVNDSDYVSEHLLSHYSLPANTTTLSFVFSGIDFKSLGNVSFRYHLKNLNDHWQQTRENMVQYEALPAGTYIFEVYTVNAEGLQSANPASVTVTIERHWWQRLPFLVTFGLISLTLSVLLLRHFFNIRHRKQLKEASLKKQVAEIELKAIKAQINPHFIFNTLNSIQYFIGNQRADEAELYLSRLGKLLRKTLDFSNKSEVSVEDEINYLDNYLQLEKLRFDETFSYEIVNHLPPMLRAQVKMPPMVLQPHIENALKHSFHGIRNKPKHILIEFDSTPKQLICTVQDNGIGRKASWEHKNDTHLSHNARGIELSEAKLQMFEKLTGKNVRTEIVDLYENNAPAGTKIIITINLTGK